MKNPFNIMRLESGKFCVMDGEDKICFGMTREQAEKEAYTRNYYYALNTMPRDEWDFDHDYYKPVEVKQQ